MNFNVLWGEGRRVLFSKNGSLSILILVVLVGFTLLTSRQGRTEDSLLETSLTRQKEEQIAEVIKLAEKSFFDRHGFMKLYPREMNGQSLDNENPVLFTSEYFFLLKKLGALQGAFFQSSKEKVKKMIALLRLEKGLFNRYPGRKGQAFHRHFSRDEQIGLVTLDWAFNGELGFIGELYGYGKKHSYIYENRTWSSPGKHKRRAYGENGKMISGKELEMEGQRAPEFVDYIRVASGREHTFWGSLVFCESLKVTQKRPKEDVSGKILAYLRIEIMEGKDSQTDKCIDRFKNEMQVMYGTSPWTEIFRIYFHHPHHPIIKMADIFYKD